MPPLLSHNRTVWRLCNLVHHFLIFISFFHHRTVAFYSPVRPWTTVSSSHRFYPSFNRLNYADCDATSRIRMNSPIGIPTRHRLPVPLSSHLYPMTLLDTMTRDQAETIAGPFFGASLFPYLLFLYFLNVPNNQTPKGVVVGFATCLLFVFLTIPAAVAAQSLYGVSLADSDWLHGSAESLLTITNIITVLGFRQALSSGSSSSRIKDSYRPMTLAVLGLTGIAGLTAWIPATEFGAMTQVHFPYLGGWLDIPQHVLTSFTWLPHMEPLNALTVECWVIHISSLVEFLIAMGLVWQWADVTGNPKWKGLTWGLLPLHTSGIIACTYHLFYNQLPALVPLQALMTLIGNTTAAYAAYRLAVSNGWSFSDMPILSSPIQSLLASVNILPLPVMEEENQKMQMDIKASETPTSISTSWLIGFEDVGPALATETDVSFVIKLFAGCTAASYAIKYGELLFDFPFDANIQVALSIIFLSSALNAFKWWKRSQDPNFDSWL